MGSRVRSMLLDILFVVDVTSDVIEVNVGRASRELQCGVQYGASVENIR